MFEGDALVHLGYQSLMFVAIGAVVHFVTRYFGFRYRPCSFPSAKASSLCGIVAVLVGWLLITLLFLSAGKPRDVSQEPVIDYGYNAYGVISQAIVALIAFSPIILVMRRRRESWATAGVSTHNLGRSFVVGILIIVLCVVFMTIFDSRRVGESDTPLTVDHYWALILFAIVGFGEEFAFRGYLQIRLIAWLGKWRGWVVTSVVMALAHVSQRIAVGGLPPLEAVGSSAALIPVSLFSGYVMIRTENIVAPGLFHTFADWVNTLS